MNNWSRPALKTLINKPNLVGAEIGVDSGENALYILTYLDIKKLYLIDIWKGYNGLNGHGVIGNNDIAENCFNQARERLKDYNNKIVWIRDYSTKAVKLIDDEELDFVYIDGNHRYEYVKEDIIAYYPRVKIGGLVSGHDFKEDEPGVEKAVREILIDKQKETVYKQNWDWWTIKKGIYA